MHLKRLDLVGFKSFATRTVFAFEPGISILCGPNGSGKSNVSDAVRWALGEQSARAIRGRRGEDVIFVGSQGRQPLGLSEVSLTLDNSDGRIPLDYDEVKITRRLYRSGEAEYLVNGSRVRLKDVHGWLLHAALDPEAYVVVGQGSVDELILQRPEERRVVLENAADIRRHQARLAEARSRVAATEENLLRCRAVVSELEPHVKRLQHQAERAERYGALRDELVRVATAWFRHALRQAVAELRQARAQAGAARADRERLEAELADLEALVGRADAAAGAAEDELGRHEPVLSGLLAEQARLSAEHAVASERRRAATEAASALEVELGTLRQRASVLRAEVAASAERLARERASLVAEEEAFQAADGERAARERSVDAAEQELDRLRRRAAALEGEVRAARAVLDDALDRAGRADRRRPPAEEAVARAQAELAGARRGAELLRGAARQRQEEAAALRRAREELTVARDDVRRLLDAQRSERHRLEGERQQLEMARGALQEVPTGPAGGVASHLARELAGACGLLGAELHVPERFQTLVSAVLGESTHAVLVEAPTVVEAGLEIVRQRGADRTRLVALEADVGAAVRAALEFQHVARPLLAGLDWHGFADELVGCEPALEAVRARYLARVVVAADLAAAREAARRLAASADVGAPWQVATPAGEVVRWDGEWRAGRSRPAERLVGRRRQLADLDAALGRQADALAQLETRIGDAERRAAALADEEQAARATLAEAERLERQSGLAAETAVADVARLERELASTHAAVANAAAELERARRQVAVAERRLATAEAARADLAPELDRAGAAVSALRAAREQLGTAQAERRAEIAAARSTLDSREALLARDRDELASLERSLQAAEARLRSETTRVESEGARAEQLNAARAEATARAGSLAETVAALREQRRLAASRRADVERDAAALRATIRGQRTVLEAALLTEGRAADRVDRVRREAREFLDELDGAAEDLTRQLDLGLDPAERDGEAHPPSAQEALADPESVRRRMNAVRRELRAIGPINDSTLAEFAELRDRHAFLTAQVADLETTLAELRSAMADLEGSMQGAFGDAFARVNVAFGEYFGRLFGGGHAELVLTRPDDVLETGVDIVARPPGKRLQPLVSLSGGERALTMVALIFGLLKTNPAPFCVLDEVDAALDESNVLRFTDMLQELSERTQFIVVTHNRATMEIARALYGISMDTRGVSTVVSLRLPEAVPS